MFKKLLIASALICATSVASAAVVTQTATLAVDPTNYDADISFNQFDASLGTLNFVSITVDGTVTGIVRAESLDATATSIVATLEASLTLTDAGGSLLVTSVPTISETNAVSAFDNDVDFGGTSGVTVDDLVGTDSASAMFTSGAILASYTGAGTMDFVFDAAASSIAEGPGNIISQLNTQAGALITVIYDYTAAPVVGVSAPGHLALLGGGLLAFAGFRNSRK